MLTREQLQQNIEAMERQGASQADIQGYLDSQKQAPQAAPTPQQTPTVTHGGISLIADAMANFGKSLAPGLVDTLGTNMAAVAGGAKGALQKIQGKPVDQSLNYLPEPSLKRSIGAGVELAGVALPGPQKAAPLARVAVSAAQGAAALGGEAAAANADTGTIAKQAAKGGALSAVISGAGEALKVAGKAIYKFIIPRDTREAGLLQTYRANTPFAERVAQAAAGKSTAPRTAADTSFDKGLVGFESNLGVQAKRATGNLWDNLIHPQLQASKAKIDMPSFFDDIEKTIVADNPELSRQKSLLEALAALKDDYKGVAQVPLAQLQKFKEGWAQFIPDKAYQNKPIAGAFKDVQDTAAHLAREAIYDNLGPEVQRAYIDYGNLKAIQELGKKAMAGGRFKGGFGGFWSAIKDFALTPVMTIGGRTIYRVGEGIEMVGAPGALTVEQLLLGSTSEEVPQSLPQPTEQQTL